ncbi:hypothetical protein [Anabaena azotica]|uniref:hypothetical protein n=1 Tax=Anabaena azotica TaxID=197653 RepID=UPI0039A455DF
MLHLFMKSIETKVTQPSNLMIGLAANANLSPLDPPNTAANQPASGWFLFQIFNFLQKLYFMLRCINTIGKNVGAELVT